MLVLKEKFSLSCFSLPPLSSSLFTAALRAEGAAWEPQYQSASELICNNRLITAFHPSFPLHPAEQGSRPDLLVHSSPAAYHQQAIIPRDPSTSSLGEDPAQTYLFWHHQNIRWGWTHADSGTESSAASSNSSALPASPPYLLLQPQEKGQEPAFRVCYLGISRKETGKN